MEVGNVIHYDFTFDFPEMKKQPELIRENVITVSGKEDIDGHLWRVEGKYTRLLERYIRLLEIVARLAMENGLYSLHEKIQKLIEQGNVATSR
ncbi:MAG: hypothetical protein BGO68_03670 [Candidatus Amoebophilus sp. 36-38]|nr:MAG: hypothetical protein BGO68_03670 [Candidatus Amoebophilus sp. 36-38]